MRGWRSISRSNPSIRNRTCKPCSDGSRWISDARARTAFDRLPRRNDSAALDQFVVALLQAEELGTPLTEALDQIAVEMRRATAQRARQQASRTSPRVALVVTMVMVPGALVLLVVSLLLSSGVDLGKLGG